jgi:hypothetical protein
MSERCFVPQHDRDFGVGDGMQGWASGGASISTGRFSSRTSNTSWSGLPAEESDRLRRPVTILEPEESRE